jgi:adenosine deaminase
MVTINSDDPAYFGGYMNENYIGVANALDLSKKQIIELAKNSFKSSFLSDDEKEKMIMQVEQYYQNN